MVGKGGRDWGARRDRRKEGKEKGQEEGRNQDSNMFEGLMMFKVYNTG